MAPADREAVLRGVNARFDESGDDDAVIKALGSPTFAAVQVLRGYVAPDPEEHRLAVRRCHPGEQPRELLDIFLPVYDGHLRK